MTAPRPRNALAAMFLALVLAAPAALLAGPSATAHAADPAPEAPKQPEAPAFLEKTAERGPVKARVRLEPAAPVIGDTVTLLLEVTAADGIELVMPEFGQSLERFSVREFVPREALDAGGSTVSSQRYVLEPPLSGPQAIPPLMIEFVDRRPGQKPAPEGEPSYELVTERIPFEVASVVPEGASNELKPLRERLEPLREPGSPWPWVIALLLVAVVVGPLLWRRWQAARAEGRRRSAYDVARARLDTLTSRKRPDDENEIDVFFVELSAIIRRYLEDRFELRAPELTTEEFLTVASASPDLDQAHQGFLQSFLRRADMVKFARFIPPPDDIEAALSAASRFLEETRQPPAHDHTPGAAQPGAVHA